MVGRPLGGNKKSGKQVQGGVTSDAQRGASSPKVQNTFAVLQEDTVMDMVADQNTSNVVVEDAPGMEGDGGLAEMEVFGTEGALEVYTSNSAPLSKTDVDKVLREKAKRGRKPVTKIAIKSTNKKNKKSKADLPEEVAVQVHKEGMELLNVSEEQSFATGFQEET